MNLEEAKKHYQHLAPHVKQRATAKILKWALDELEGESIKAKIKTKSLTRWIPWIKRDSAT